jgi:hypothetical protein
VIRHGHHYQPDIETVTIRVEESDAFDERVLNALAAIEDEERDLERALSLSLAIPTH